MASVNAFDDFLRVPPFPAARRTSLEGRGSLEGGDRAELDRLIGLVREMKVGGAYWAAQPPLLDNACIVRIRDPRLRDDAIAGASRPIMTWIERGWSKSAASSVAIVGPCDPWHVLGAAEKLITDIDDDVALIALLKGVGVKFVGDAETAKPGIRERLGKRVSAAYMNPFTGEDMDCEAAVKLCGLWRRMIDSNRQIGAAVGFAFWKRRTVAPLLWGGAGEVPFMSHVAAPDPARQVAIWKSRTGEAALAQLQRTDAPLIEVEDGFIRSVGLGSDCVPPLSIIVDSVGIYFDPARPSELELLLQEGRFSPETLERARSLRERIVELGITKYAVGDAQLQNQAAAGPRLLVVGQVEDDRAILEGTGPKTNVQLLERVREANPGAHVIYKPHPDVEAGHRRGAIPDEQCLELADEIVRDAPISSLIALVDEVHVNSSLAGFEALLRGRPVTTYGVPFYAGWGLTRDLGPVPKRRTARRTLDELVAAALLLYPRYLDPVTGLPCPPEIQITRLSESGSRSKQSGIVQLRRLQGRWNRALAGLRS